MAKAYRFYSRSPRQAAMELPPAPDSFTLCIEKRGRALGLQLRGLQVVASLLL